MKRNFKLVAFLVLAVLVGSATLALTRARAERLKSHDLKPVAPEQSESAGTNQSGKTYSQDLAKVLTRHDLVEFEPRRVAEQVRTTGKLTVPSSSGTFELTLAPHDLRASNYRAQVSLGGGEERALERGPVRTYKGTVAGLDGAQARFTIDDTTLEGLIITPTHLYFVEPAKRYSSLAGSKDYLVYSDSDVIENSFGECGTTMAEKVGAEAARVKSQVTTSLAHGGTEELFTPPRVVDLATEADFEYFTFFGSNAVNANNEIISIVNQVDGIYNTQFGIRFSIVFQNVWATASDPYTSTDSDVALDQFRDEWNSNRGSVARDLAHMWTGKDFDDTTIGIAYRPGLDCPLGPVSYGMSQRLGTTPAKFLLAAHEIGHNFNATHTDGETGCDNTIMASTLSGSTLQQFCPFSVNQIETHANSRVACLSQATTPGCSYSLAPTSQAFGSSGGAGSVALTTTGGSSCAWGATPSVGWIHVTSATSGTNSATINYTVDPNSGGFARTGLIRVADQSFTITQSAGASCSITSINYGQTVNASLSVSDCRSSQRSGSFADQYSFSGSAGDQIRIEMTASGSPVVDTYLYLIGPAGNVLTENDDIEFAVILNSRIPVNGFFTLPAAGTYIIEATSFDQDEVGNYALTLTLNGANPTPTPTPTPTPGVVQFSASTASATETLNATTKVDITVTRTVSTSGAASVNYATTDLTTNERSDYLATLGTLRFAPGETSKTITVFIVDDSYGEGTENFQVLLNTPVGCSIGTPAIVNVTVNSDEAINGANPVRDASFSSDFFVRQHYIDFFNREADAGGLAFWKNQIDECTTQACREIRRINVSAAFYVSIEFQQTGYLVYKAYQASFNLGENLDLRSFLPDTQEIGRGVIIGQPGADAQLETNKQNFFLNFVQREAFVQPSAYPLTMTAAQFVDKLNGNTLDPLNAGAGPSLTQSERDALVAQLSPDPASSTLRAQVLRSVSENGEFSRRQFNKAFVLMQYFGYLRRNPNALPDTNFDGYNFWLGKLNQFNGNFVNAEMVKAFITSGEYIQRFGP